MCGKVRYLCVTFVDVPKVPSPDAIRLRVEADILAGDHKLSWKKVREIVLFVHVGLLYLIYLFICQITGRCSDLVEG